MMKWKDCNIYYLLESTKMENFARLRLGGAARNILARARLLSKELDKPIHILTFDHNPDIDHTRQAFFRTKMIDERIIVHNLFEFLSHKKVSWIHVDEKKHPIEEKGLVSNKVEKYENRYRMFKNGLYIKYKAYDDQERLEFVDYFSENRHRLRREQFDIAGRVRKITYMDQVLNKPRQELFYDETGHCYLSIWYNPNNGKSTRVNWFDQQGQIIKVFKNIHALKVHWLETITEKLESAIFQSDMRNTEELLLAMKNPKIATVKMFHSNHFEEPYTYGSLIKEYHSTALENVSRFDAFVLITERQKKDVERQFGPRSTFHTVPHAAPRISAVGKEVRDPLTAVKVGRYVKTKNFDHAIYAFQKVIEKIPEARLELWGFGPQEENLKELVRKLKLESNVFVKGFTDHSTAIFERAAFSVFPTTSEGFPLVILESMAAGAPVISYDLNYGPHEMITHNVDGILIPQNNIDALSEAMITLFTDQKKLKLMSQKARKVTQKLSEKRFVQNWLTVYEAALHQREHRVKIKKPSCTLTNLQWLDAQSGKMKLDGIIVFSEESTSYFDSLQLSLYVRKRDQLIDCYIPLQVEWKNERTAQFNTELLLNTLIDNNWLKSGIWDFYISCSAKNDHRFIRLAGNKEKDIPWIKKVVTTPKDPIVPYYTEYGNFSLDVGLHKHRTTTKKIIGKVKRLFA